MAIGGGRRLPEDPNFPAIATDWKDGDTYSGDDLIFREGKWWNRWHWVQWRRDQDSDRRKLNRNRALGRFLRLQAPDTTL